MTSFILALILLFYPDGSDKSARGKHTSAQRQTQPVKQTVLLINGSNQQPDPNVNNEAPAINRRMVPAVTNISQGITSIYTEQVTYGDTVQKQTTEPAAELKWLP